MIKRILGTLLLTLILTAQTSYAAPFNANAKTKRIPAGTEFELKMMTNIDTSYSPTGSDFSAMLLSDQTADDDVILPSGSVIRGDIKGIAVPKRMSKGAILYLNFDHVVTPNGRQLPLSLNVIGRSDLTSDGGITTTRGYFDAWKKTCATSGHITRNAVKSAENIANDTGWKYVTVPVWAFGGAIGSAGYFVYGSVADMIKKGAQVKINKNDIIRVILAEPIDVPVI